MLSRPFALGLVAVACVVAAGGGAYIATLQHARHEAAVAATPALPADATVPAPQAAPAAAPGLPPAPAGQGAALEPALPDEPRPTARSAARVTPHQGAPADRTSRGARQTAAQREADPVTRPPADPAPTPAAQAPAPVPAPTDLPAVKEPSRAEPERTWAEVTVPEDSVVGLQLETPLSSETAHVEDRVDARVTRDVRVNGQVAIPAGSHVVGTVVLVERGGKIRDRARLGVRFDTLILADASRVPLSTEAVYREGVAPSKSSSAKIGGGAIGGAIIGAILGGGKGAAIGSGIGAAGGTAAAMAGDRRPVVLPVGTPLSVRTQSPVTITVER